MNWWIFILPLTAACIGWMIMSLLLLLIFHPLHPKKIIGYRLQGIIPAKQQMLAREAGKLGASLLSIKEIEAKITHPDNVKKIMPQAEEQIDHFLRVKLIKSMPVVGMFVGDKTINNLKSLFVEELEELFPEIMKKYMNNLQEDFNVEKMIADKIAALSPVEIEIVFLQKMKKELTLVKLTGALTGLIIGLIQLVIMLLIAH